MNMWFCVFNGIISAINSNINIITCTAQFDNIRKIYMYYY